MSPNKEKRIGKNTLNAKSVMVIMDLGTLPIKKGKI